MDAAPHRDVTPLFVLGGHRGGTTLLQRLLNSYDGVTIWGEHEGVLTPIADAYFQGADSKAMFADIGASDPQRDWQAWMSAVDRNAWDASFHRLVTSLFLPASSDRLRYWGFKEIRYGTTPGDRAVDLLAKLFPDARFVFLVRNPFNMLASAHSRPEGPRSLPDVVRACERLACRFESFRRWHADARLRSYWLVYEELAQEKGAIHPMLADLGLEIGPAQRAVIAAEGEGRGSSFRDDAVNERWRRLPASWLAVAREMLGPVATALGYALPPVSPVWRVMGPWMRRRL